MTALLRACASCLATRAAALAAVCALPAVAHAEEAASPTLQFASRGPHLLQGELADMRRWNENGVFLGLADRYTINDDWYTFLAVGAGNGASYLPRTVGLLFDVMLFIALYSWMVSGARLRTAA